MKRNSFKKSGDGGFKSMVLTAVAMAKEEKELVNGGVEEAGDIGSAVDGLINAVQVPTINATPMQTTPITPRTASLQRVDEARSLYMSLMGEVHTQSKKEGKQKAEKPADDLEDDYMVSASRRTLPTWPAVRVRAAPAATHMSLLRARALPQVGALSVESYVVFRTRPLLEGIEKGARFMSIQIQVIEVVVFIIQSVSAVPPSRI